MSLAGKRILLVVGGGIAAYKALLLVRLIARAGGTTTCVLTRAGREFVTPLSLQALSGRRVFEDLWSLTDESEMGHIELSRAADVIVIAPATADLLAKMTAGLADDLASTLLLATDTPVLAAPAMNVRMWLHPATVANVATLAARGLDLVGPGRMAEPEAILAAIIARLAPPTVLAGRRALVTAGPTHEALDPVRFLGNRSSGRQGYAIAAALARAGAAVTLVSGPTALPDPPGLATIRVESAAEMLAACEAALPAEVAVCAAAVADWRPERVAAGKLKKRPGEPPPALALVPNPDILARLSEPGPRRPRLVVGFAAETEEFAANARDKRRRKGCDWILVNDVGPGTAAFGGERNTVRLITEAEEEEWPDLPKTEIASRLAERIGASLAGGHP